MSAPLVFPRRGRGRPTAASQARYENEVRRWCAAILEINSRLDFQVGSRGWCYVLEGKNLITKSDFDQAQRLINDCRKDGRLPVDICVEDGKRAFACVEPRHSRNAADHAAALVERLRQVCDEYVPISFWDDKPVYVEMLVEKIDLRSLFEPVCDKYRIPIANAGGNADINQRFEMMRRFARHEAQGRQCVLLYCGDFDPSGVRISEGLRNNLAALAAAAGWSPDHLEIDRFGLNYDFIVAHRLTWIDNLETSNPDLPPLDHPRHPDHNKPYVQDYLAQYGARKVEANALVVAPEAGRKLCQDAILRWVGDADAPLRYEERLQPWREQLVEVLGDGFGEMWQEVTA